MKVKLYKYTPHIDSFVKKPLLRCTHASALNDPFELQPTLDVMEKYSRHHGKSYRHQDIVKYFRIQSKISGGVIALSETNDNILMWSHYADEHKDGVIELTFDIKFDQNGKMLQRGLFKTMVDNNYLFDRVKYRSSREPHDELFQTAGVNLTMNLNEHLAFIKADVWCYEKEFRFLCSPIDSDIICTDKNDCVKISLDSIGLDYEVCEFNEKLYKLTSVLNCQNGTIDLDVGMKLHQLILELEKKGFSTFNFYEIEPDCITGIYLGCKFPKSKLEEFSSREYLKHYTNLGDNLNIAEISSERFDIIFKQCA